MKQQEQPRRQSFRRDRGRMRVLAPATPRPPIEVFEVFAPRAGEGAILGPYEDVYPVSHGYAIADPSEER
jgi:hypothetical protein